MLGVFSASDPSFWLYLCFRRQCLPCSSPIPVSSLLPRVKKTLQFMLSAVCAVEVSVYPSKVASLLGNAHCYPDSLVVALRLPLLLIPRSLFSSIMFREVEPIIFSCCQCSFLSSFFCLFLFWVLGVLALLCGGCKVKLLMFHQDEFKALFFFCSSRKSTKHGICLSVHGHCH